jgi:cold-inducible RNA-binding protein
MSTKLFVGNLSFNTTENDLQEAFAAHGTVVEANLMMDRMSGRSRGFAFVTMSTPEEAQKAIAAMNGATLGERQLTVNIARPKEERPRGDRGPRRDFGGGGGGGGGGRGIVINHRQSNFGRGDVLNGRRPGRFMARIFYWLSRCFLG